MVVTVTLYTLLEAIIGVADRKLWHNTIAISIQSLGNEHRYVVCRVMGYSHTDTMHVSCVMYSVACDRGMIKALCVRERVSVPKEKPWIYCGKCHARDCWVRKRFQSLCFIDSHEFLLYRHKLILNHVESSIPLASQQWGFRSGRSTVSVLLDATYNWLQAINKVKEVCCVFFDLHKAFDSVPHHSLLEKLKSLGLSEHLLKWIFFLPLRKGVVRRSQW